MRRLNCVLVVLLCFFVFSCVALAQEYQVSYLSVNDGLSHNQVTSIIKDNDGFMWFGTRGGLNRYDGYEFKHYKPSDKGDKTLHHPSVEVLYKAKDGEIYIGTKSAGYSLYRPDKELFMANEYLMENSDLRIISFYEDHQKNIWAGTWSSGLISLSQDQDSVHFYSKIKKVSAIIQTPDSKVWLGSRESIWMKEKDHELQRLKRMKAGFYEITEMAYDESEDCIWCVGWNLGLVKFDYKNLRYTEYEIRGSKGKKLSSYSLLKDKNGKIWVGTWGEGLYTFDQNNDTFQKVNLSQYSQADEMIQPTVILDIFQEDNGDIWLGTHRGIVRLSAKGQFNVAKGWRELGDEKMVSSIVVDSQDKLWMATTDYLYQYSNKRLRRYNMKRNTIDGFSNVGIGQLVYDQGDIFVCFDVGVLLGKKNKDGSFVFVNAQEELKIPGLNGINKVRDIKRYGDELWLATQQKGLYLYVKKGNQYVFKRNFTGANLKGQLKDTRVTGVFRDKNNVMWVSTYKGLYKYNSDESVFISIEDYLQDGKRLQCDIILCSYVDQDNNIWFGTPCGLNQLVQSDEYVFSLKEYTQADGLPDDYINSIIEDDGGDIWVSTNGGLSKLNVKTQAFSNFNQLDGIEGSSFIEAAGCKAKDGVLYFAGDEGVVYFNPKSILYNDYNPEIVVTSFKVLNHEVNYDEKGILSKNINETQRIVLGYKEKEFSIEFASLDYKAPKLNHYAYQLKGYNDRMVYIGSRRHVSFNNLSPGDYTLILKGTNSNGVWSDKQYEVDITIKPAPWKTWYAILIYIVVIFGGVVAISWVGVRQERLTNSIEVERYQRQQETELNEYKFRFFTNISHELRTPLTLILAPINELIKKETQEWESGYLKDKLRLIYQNAKKLHNLIDLLLEFRKMEAGKLKLEVEEVDFKEFAGSVVESFAELAKSKQVVYSGVFDGDDWRCFVDTDKMGMVINNLLSNAFKYAGQPGMVNVKAKSLEDTIVLEVINNGRGISEDELQYLFERFYQADGQHHMGSSGIGLSLIKNYLDLHQAVIKVQSKRNELTSFVITLKKGREHLRDEDIRVCDKRPALPVEPIYSSHKKLTRSLNVGAKGARVLVVEDNAELRSYIVELLEVHYHVLEAENGLEGYELVVEHKPDLVISDVMMPKMDGFELCQKIKLNDTISLTPVILLTAKATPRDQLFGAKKGAEVYMTKPFDPELLLEKSKMLIAGRKKMSVELTQKVVLAPTNAPITSEEQAFLQSAMKVMEQYLGDVNFDAQKLAKEMAMSNSTLYRKTKKIIKKSPAEFIKYIRFQRAAQLIEESNLTISEIAESIGYVDLKSFRKIFKQQYHMTPTEFREQKK
ncbi:hybrid sensor histidine kinase/response regulator transcription factor [Saccharicrinis fermentans]|nr:two-component regulator propeller domain-containing protein [Saccharicrinis fermentans]